MSQVFKVSVRNFANNTEKNLICKNINKFINNPKNLTRLSNSLLFSQQKNQFQTNIRNFHTLNRNFPQNFLYNSKLNVNYSLVQNNVHLVQFRSKFTYGTIEIKEENYKKPKNKLKFLFLFLFIAFLLAIIIHILASIFFVDDFSDFSQLSNSLLRFYLTMRCAATTAVDYKWNLYGLDPESEEYKTIIKPIHKRAAERILELCRTNQGLYVKAGQYIASLNHLLPIEYTSTLRVLQDKAPYKSFDMVEEIFKEDFGYSTEYFFKEIDHLPLASASLAQVHRAVTLDGFPVAVKVQYKQLQGQFKGDMLAQDVIFYTMSKLFKSFDFSKVAGDDLKNLLKSELDFINESSNINRATINCTIPRVYFPIVYPEITSKRVLTMEFIDGVKINNVEKIKEMGFNLKEVYTTMFEAFAEQIFIHGFFHSDPHPGNIFVRKHPNKKIGGYEVVILDHGLYQTLQENNRINYCHLWKNMIEMDHQKIKFYTRKLGVDEKDYLLFTNIVLMRSFHKNIKGLDQDMTDSDLKQLHEFFRNKVGEMMEVMASLPREFMLVLRNHNLLRSVNLEVGVPVNRFSIFARMAVRGISDQHKNINADADFMTKFKSNTLSFFERYRFEFKLRLFEVSNWVIEKLVSLFPDYFFSKFIEITTKPAKVVRAA